MTFPPRGPVASLTSAPADSVNNQGPDVFSPGVSGPNLGASPEGDRAAGLRPQPPTASSLSSIPSAVSKYPPPIGEQPAIQWLPTCALMVDRVYQRLTTSRASIRIIEQIAVSWDWRLCAPLTVSHRPGDGYYVIDGQHRLEAAAMRADIEELPCLVSQFEGVEDEARCFVAINAVRRMPSSLDQVHARCASNDAGALELRELVTDAGLRLARTPGWQTWKAGDVAFIGAIVKAVRDYGRTFASAALVNISEAFGDRVLTRGKVLFEGLVLIHAKPDREIDPDDLLDVLRTRPQEIWAAAANCLQANGLAPNQPEAMRRAIMDAYAEHARIAPTTIAA